MDEKIKELVAIGASVTGHCQSCLEYHIKEATRLGASSKDIHMAICLFLLFVTSYLQYYPIAN